MHILLLINYPIAFTKEQYILLDYPSSINEWENKIGLERKERKEENSIIFAMLTKYVTPEIMKTQ